MLLLLLIWVIFGGTCFLTGHFILILLHFDKHFSRTYDRAFVAVWLGVALLAPLFLALSIAFALKPAVVLVAYGTVVCLSLGYATNRRAMLNCVREISLPAAAGTLLVALGVSAYTSQFITLYDSGLYHIQAIRWLGEYGTVPGIALIHDRLGFTSAWFALTAPFDHGSSRGHVYAALGGFVLFMMIHALGVGLSRVARDTAQHGDYFLVSAFALPLPQLLLWRMGVSPSPDLPVIVLIVVIAWTYLQTSETTDANNLLNIRLIPLLLSLGAITIKLSAMPLIVVTSLFYCLVGGGKLRRMVLTGGLLCLFGGPYLVVSMITSGYPLFPSSLISINMPWTLPVGFVQETERAITEWARWSGRLTPPGGNSYNWILPWIKEHIYFSLGVVVSFWMLALLIVATLQWKAKKGQKGQGAFLTDPRAIAIAVAGLSFSIWKAPELRFAIGYLVIIPALLLALTLEPTVKQLRLRLQAASLLPFGFLTVIGVALHIWFFPLPAYSILTKTIQQREISTESNPHVNWLLPAEVLQFHYTQKAGVYFCERLHHIEEITNNLDYRRPDPEDAELCWDLPLPCAPGKIENVRMRNSSEGLSAGFVMHDAGNSSFLLREHQ